MRIRVASLTALVAAALFSSGCAGTPQTSAEIHPPPAEVASAPGPAPAASKPATAPVVKPQSVTTEATATKSEDGKFFGYLKKVTLTGQEVVVTVDYAQMLSGKAAADAAKAHGDESPPPNDYYIVNDNPKLRTFTLSKAASVRYLIGGEPALHPVSASGFLDKWENATGDATILRNPYWLTIKRGAIVVLEQQYLP